MSDIDRQTVVVTGGTSGIGRAIANMLARDGAKVIPTSRTKSRVIETAELVDCDIICPTDVKSREEVKHLFSTVAKHLGEVNVVINSAGIFFDEHPIDEMEDEKWQEIMQTNLYGTFITSQIAPKFMGGKNQAIVNISSIGGHVPLRNQPTYTASKFGVNGLTKALAVEYANRGIRVNAVAPGYTKTRQNIEYLEDTDVKQRIHNRTPLSRYADLDEIASTARFLASPMASFITGEIITVDGGLSLLPSP